MNFRKWLFNHSRDPDAGDIAARLLADPRSATHPPPTVQTCVLEEEATPE